MHYDLVIRGGTIVDGKGGEPYQADLAITNGLVAEIGRISGGGREEIDAKGFLVTPGFVDIHTHYDGQASWDARLTPSSWHGVTTAVMGNCGVGFAPVHPADRDRLIDLMEGVEDIPRPCLHEGLKWRWETFSEYMDVLATMERDMDICTLLPHAALRLYVMGERALRLEPASEQDIAKMRSLTADAMRAGAFGFSTSRTLSHKTLKGDPTPTLRAAAAELAGLAQGLTDAGGGFIELISDWDAPEAEFDMVRGIVVASGRPALISVNQKHDRPDLWRKLMSLMDQAVAEGLPIRPVVAPRPIGVLLGLQSTQNPFSGTRSYRSIADKPLAERVAIMRDPTFRARVLSEDPLEMNTLAVFRRMSFERMFEFSGEPNYTPDKNTSLAAIAAREGRTAPEVAYDLLLRDEGRSFLFTAMVNYFDFNLDACREMLLNPNALPGLGDGGAHVGFVSDASFTTFLLTYWGRDAQVGRMSVAEVIRRQCADTAHAVGLTDRGTLEIGKRADINVIDFANLHLDLPYMTFDLPAGGGRLLQKARGYKATIVAGQTTYRDGEATGALPGRMVRGPHATARHA